MPYSDPTMTNYTQYILATFAALLMIPPVTAQADQAWTTDAFGLLPAQMHSDSARAMWSGLRETFSADGKTQATYHPSGPSESLLLHVGPKSSVAGKDKVHIIAMGFDQHGNLAHDHETVTLHLSDTNRHETTLRDGLAHHLFRPVPTAGSYFAGAETTVRQSGRATYRVVPNLSGMTPSIAPVGGRLAAEAPHELTLTGLRDAYGNPAGHGAALQIVIKKANGSNSIVTALSTGPTAEARLLTRGLSGMVEATANLGAITTSPRRLRIERLRPQRAPDLIATALPDLSAVRLRIGPFRTTRGHHLQDGATVTILTRIADGTPHVVKTSLRDGWAESLLPITAKALPAPLSLETPLGTIHMTLSLSDLKERP